MTTKLLRPHPAGGFWLATLLGLLWVGSQGCATRDNPVDPGGADPARGGCLACHADSDRLQSLLPPNERSGGVQRALDDG